MSEEGKKEFYGTGRRKCAVARVRICSGNGQIRINGKEVIDFSALEHVENTILAPINVSGVGSSIDVTAETYGGGVVGQAGAVSLGLARALEKMNPDLRASLKKAGLLTRDSRVHERKKPGQRGARRRFQFSKR